MLFLSTKETKQKLLRQLEARTKPQLSALGYRQTRKSYSGFPPKWYRDNGATLDMLEFHWDKFGLPSFLVWFRGFDHPDDLADVRSNLAEATPGIAGFAIAGYKLGLLSRSTFLVEHKIEQIIDVLRDDLEAIDGFLKGGESSSRMSALWPWYDQRLPDTPPPWPTCRYHLPQQRLPRSQTGARI